MNSTGLIPKIFGKIAEAQRPDRFTQDYLANVIGYGSGSGRPIIPLLKRLNFLQPDGTPSPLYARFRNPSERAAAMLEALKTGYSDLYARSEYAHTRPKEKFRDLVVEVTGLERDSSVVDAIVGTFSALKTVGGVTDATKTGAPETVVNGTAPTSVPQLAALDRSDFGSHHARSVGMNLSYTINLNLPPSADPEVFNAIFRALKEHMLRG
jgi:Family of unknown function (DUF5343)